MEELCCRVEELWEEGSRLCSTGKAEREIERIVSETQHLKEPKLPSAVGKQAVSNPTIKVRETSREGEGWTLIIPGATNKVSAPPEDLQLYNRFTTLKVEGEP